MRIVFAIVLLLTRLRPSTLQRPIRILGAQNTRGGALGGSGSCYFMTIEQCRATMSGSAATAHRSRSTPGHPSGDSRHDAVPALLKRDFMRIDGA